VPPNFAHFGYKTVPTSRDGFNVVVSEIFAKSLAEKGNFLREADLFNKRIRPNLTEEFFLVYYPTTAFNQNKQRLEGLWRQGHKSPVAKQNTLTSIQTERSEFIKMLGGVTHEIGQSIGKPASKLRQNFFKIQARLPF